MLKSGLRNTELDNEVLRFTDKDLKELVITTFIQPHPTSFEGRCISFSSNSNKFILNDNDMFELGMTLINQSKKAFKYNEEYKTLINKKDLFRAYIASSAVKEVTITFIKPMMETGDNRYDYYNIAIVWKEGRQPHNHRDLDFNYDDVLAFPKEVEAFRFMLDYYGGIDKVRFLGDYKPQPNTSI